MMAESNKNNYLLSDSALIEQLGEQLRGLRLARNLTQGALAMMTGLDRTTVVQLENGRPVSILTFVQVLRALGKLEIFDALREEPQVSPIQAAKSQIRVRKRAAGKSSGNQSESTW